VFITNIVNIMCTRRAYARLGGAPKWSHRTIREHRNKCRDSYPIPTLAKDIKLSHPEIWKTGVMLILSAATIT